MKPILYRYKDTESVIKVMDGYTPGEGWEPLYDQAAMDAATAAALDVAAELCDELSIAEECATAIRALKEARAITQYYEDRARSGQAALAK